MRKKLKRWMQLTEKSLRMYGVKYTARKIKAKVVKKITGRELTLAKSANRVIHDVLFVNGCDPIAAPHPYRYRVLHQMEQLRAAGYSVAEIYYSDCTPISVCDASIIVFYRCPYTENVGGAIKLAKELNKRVLYDIDDLVIDKAYTDTIPAVQQLDRAERALYDEGVVRMGATLDMCEAATTTTFRLRQELLKHVPDVFINRNCASECMMGISDKVYKGRQNKENNDVIIGYFSGSLTHNADFEMIKPALIKVMRENSNVKLLLMGELDLPEDLKECRSRIIRKPFSDWKKLPSIIGSVDINLAPIENSVFNEAKSENKWVEAALVGVATVASRVGAFSEMIEDGVNGFLCDEDEWYDTLTEIIEDKNKRDTVAKNAREYCVENYVTTNNYRGLKEYYSRIRAKRIAFVLPSSEISGGIMVALYHACFLQDAGWDVDIIVPVANNLLWEIFGHRFVCISKNDSVTKNNAYYDVMVATMWTTVDYVMSYSKAHNKCYLVQNYETDFYPYDCGDRLKCESTYNIDKGIKYLTISKWCQNWLETKYRQNVLYVRNGINRKYYPIQKRNFEKEKIRILIEGDSAVDYKNVDESFRIVDALPKDGFEVWYLSYNGKPKESYRIDRFLHAIPYHEVGKVYSQCDILIKSSWLESFSYPPLEMMATGGYCVVVPNGGNVEYLEHESNCLFYPLGDIQAGIDAVMRICNDSEIREKLYSNGIMTAQDREWERIRESIVKMYSDTISDN